MARPRHRTPAARKRWHYYETWSWAEVLRDLRAWARITRKQLATLTGLQLRTIERWEQQRSEPNRSQQRQIAARFHKQPRGFFNAVRNR